MLNASALGLAIDRWRGDFGAADRFDQFMDNHVSSRPPARPGPGPAARRNPRTVSTTSRGPFPQDVRLARAEVRTLGIGAGASSDPADGNCLGYVSDMGGDSFSSF